MLRSVEPARLLSSRGLVAALLFLPFLLALVALPQSAVAQSENRFHMERYDSDVVVNTDGTVDVVETLAYVYDTGSFRRGTREIKADRIESIGNVRVVEVTGSGQEIEYRETDYNEDDERAFGISETFGTKDQGNKYLIRWVYDETGGGSSRTFRVSYRMSGVLRVYELRDELQWFAIPPDWGGQIYESTVRVTLPEGNYDISTLQLDADPDTPATREGNSFYWTRGNVNDGLAVGVKLPKGLVSATAPDWQGGVDAWERVEPFMNLGFAILGGFILVLGPLWAVRRWYVHGRDLPVGVYSDYVPDPPSDLPPGLVGTLLDESADVRDVIATVVDQGAKGNLVIKQTDTGGFLSQSDFEYEMRGRNVAYRYEEMVLNAVFSRGNPARLSELKNSFYKDLPPLYSEMYRTLVGLKYFPEDPSAVRARSYAVGFGFLVLAALVVGAQIFLLEGLTLFATLPAVGLFVTGIVRLALAGSMPRKTDFGAEQAQRWRAFKKYLENVQQYTDVQAAADKFQKYLPYAVALGVEKELTRQFERVPQAMPPYYIPYGWYPYPVGTPMGGQTSAGPGGVGGGGGFDMGGAMQGMSEGLGAAMSSMSESFGSMVDSAASVLTSQPSSSSSGGWGGGGGGFSGGGSSGGGGGGAD